MSYDLIVIGGGPAGYLAAERAGQAKLKTLVIEKRALGGVCLNEGCIPSKTLLHSAKIYDYARFSEKYGVKSEKVSFDHATVLKRKNKIVRMLVSGIKSKLKKNEVDVLEGEAEIQGRDENGINVSVDGNVYSGTNLLIATGSLPAIPPIPGLKEGLESGFVLTNREILDIEEIPEKLVIIGGGVIGLEMASYFNSAGSKVTVIEMLDHVGGYIDADISNILLKNYQKAGITFHLNSRVTGIEDSKVIYQVDGETVSVETDKVLISTGRKPVVNGLGLETIGVEVQNGAIIVDGSGRTNVPNVYAAGDVNGRSMLAHTAYREAEVVVNTILGDVDEVNYDAIPNVIYTNPEVASVGHTEQSAKEAGIDVDSITISMRYSGRYMAENEGGDGICKILLNKETQTIVGVHMIGSYSSEIIYGAGILVDTKMELEDIKKLVFPHPTVCEVIREGFFEF